MVSVLKVRDSDFDATIRELLIADAGVSVGGPFKGVDGVLAGATRRQPAPRKPRKSLKPAKKTQPRRKGGGRK